MLHTDRFVTVEVIDRDGSKKYFNLHSTHRNLRYMGYIERTAMNPTHDAGGKANEESNVADNDGNEHPESSSVNVKSHRGSGAAGNEPPWRRGRPAERKDRGGRTQRVATTTIGESENVKEELPEDDLNVG